MIPLPNKKYNIIYCDPAWEYRQSGSKTNSIGMTKQHYDTIPTNEICNLPIRDICTENAVCLMWATFPNIDQALTVMKSWGFIYKTAGFVWIKKTRRIQKLIFGVWVHTQEQTQKFVY